eukprot:6822219-Prymnesium_polylepis.1
MFGALARASSPSVALPVDRQAPGSWHPRSQPASLSAGNRLRAHAQHKNAARIALPHLARPGLTPSPPGQRFQR